ncbi:MAG: class I SAM-dependent rRNA methyltransferase [Lachnospiraceae bacterium]|nr:class I SAM-dependent rRNA methyltransferase [Lachnospiraceae bacterium]
MEIKAEAVVTLKKGEGRLLKSGGAWIFDNEISAVSGRHKNGDAVRVEDFDGYPLGTGVINHNSKIRVRMLTRNADAVIDETFFRERLRSAWEYRKKCVDTGSCRLVFGEADYLPGITIDKYEDILVIESLSLGTDRYKEMIIGLLKEILAEDGILIRGVFERSDAKERLKEGMERVKGFLGDPFDTDVPITENGVRYLVDVKDGQKTGFFLDQKYNRLAIRRFAENADVLDCFTHTGSFALNAAAAGASSVLAVDASENALAMAAKNAELNGFHQVEFLCADVLELLPQLAEQGKQYDLVILDPPAFTKSRNTVKAAERGYREINRTGMKLVKSGGYFATCSCSHFMSRELFEKMIADAARSAHVRLRLIEARAQSPDHPVLWGAQESYYLKFYIFQVVGEM